MKIFLERHPGEYDYAENVEENPNSSNANLAKNQGRNEKSSVTEGGG